MQNIVIVGGGTAGWLMAARLANAESLKSRNIASITLVESPNIASVGVGEGTWPTMRATLKAIGLSESKFIRHCSASFKQGTRFSNWNKLDPNDVYTHPFEPPKTGSQSNVGWHWSRSESTDRFDQATSVQAQICDDCIAPKLLTDPDYHGRLNYGYHLDAGAFAALLKEHATQTLGVNHVEADVLDCSVDQSGLVTSLSLSEGRTLSGDFFFDCTGFRGLLIHQKLKSAYISVADQLFVDKALAVQSPHGDDNTPIQSMTCSTAHQAGWIWDIGLQQRRGVGLVYSSAHMEPDEAAQQLASYLGDERLAQSARELSFDARYLDEIWKKNVVAVGLSAGFVEPLEASAIMMIEQTADWFVGRFPKSRTDLDIQRKNFNSKFSDYWRRIVEFLKFHYVLSQREEPFWQDNRRSNSIPQDLQERMEVWRSEPPFSHDFESESPIFSWESYLYVYLGMHGDEFRRNAEMKAMHGSPLSIEPKLIEKVRATLPTNRDLLNKLANQGFARV